MFISISSSTQAFQANPLNQTGEDILPLLFQALTVCFQSSLLKKRRGDREKAETRHFV